MFFRKRKRKTVEAPIAVLFQVIDEELAMGICCNIEFLYKGQKHTIGVYGDDGNTNENVLFYFDKDEYQTREELASAMLNGIRLQDMKDPVTVTECDGCYLDSTEAFRALMNTP